MTEAVVVEIINVLGLVVVALLQIRQGREAKARQLSQTEQDDRAKRQEALEEGIRVLLKAELAQIHASTVALGLPVSLELKDEADRIYHAYHALGGNGVGTQLHREIIEAHVRGKQDAVP